MSQGFCPCMGSRGRINARRDEARGHCIARRRPLAGDGRQARAALGKRGRSRLRLEDDLVSPHPCRRPTG